MADSTSPGTGANAVPTTFCAYSVFHINVSPDGTAGLCCRAEDAVTANGRRLSLHHDQFEEIWNSAYMRDVRGKMVRGERVDACLGCDQMELAGGKSLREHANACEETQRRGGLATVFEFARHLVSTQGGTAPPPSSLHFWLGNLCNLKCRMCNPQFSSQIAGDALHSRWAIGARGLGRRVVLLPDYLPLVRYCGLREGPWIDGSRVHLVQPNQPAVIVLSGTGDPLASLELSGFKDGPEPVTLVISLGQARLERSITDRAWHVNAQFETPLGCELELSISLSLKGTQRPLAIQHLALTSAPAVGKTFPKEFASRVVENPNWFQNEHVLFNEILANPEAIRFINFAGGEPLVHERIADILNLFVTAGLTRRIGLYFSTNGTVKSPALSSLLRQFAGVGLGVSIDGIGSLQEYIRFPAKWNLVVSNMLQYRDEGIADVSVQPTPQAYNLFGLLDLVRFCDGHRLNFTLNNVLFHPRYLSFEMLPQAVVEEALGEWRRYRVSECRPQFVKEVDSVIGVLERERPADVEALQDKFVAFTNDLDRARGQRLGDASPRLYDRLRAHGFDLAR